MMPVRLQLSRQKGFKLQALSCQINGLAAVMVTRPHSIFQNRWKIGTWSNRLGRAVATVAEAVECFKLTSGWCDPNDAPHMVSYAKERLRGFNLACWCRLCDRHKATGKPFGEVCADCAPCHTDPLGEAANR